MASLLKLALEGAFDSWVTGGGKTGGGGVEALNTGERDMTVELKGPLAVQLQEALAQVYNKHNLDRNEEAQEEEANPMAVSVESQANDAIMQQEADDAMRILGQAEEKDSSTTVYGVDAKDVKPEDIVEVSQDLAKFGENEEPDYVVVMDADLPSENGQGGGENAQPELGVLAKSLESMCLKRGVKVYFSMESYAKAGLDDEDEVLKVVMQMVHTHFEAGMSPDDQFFPRNIETKAATTIRAIKLVAELEKHFGVTIAREAHPGLKTPRKLAAYFKKHAPAK